MATEATRGLALAPVVGGRGTRLVPRVRVGTVLTGDVFVRSAVHARGLREELEGDAVEMEGAAIAQVAWQWGRTPVLLIRSISDSADDAARERFDSWLGVAAANSAAILRAVLGALPQR